ncbi:hypothetical protein [Rhodospirillaceae bacterium SYSU D60014]|uniref:hypothetical protein n=1 Tax=Virgifigura deserti TaxID=2268457 RepID=UPI000E668B8F
MRAVAACLRRQGLTVERDSALDADCFWIGAPGWITPSWVIDRDDRGRYQLRDDLLGIERDGASLLEILPADWLPVADLAHDPAGLLSDDLASPTGPRRRPAA